MWILNFYRFYCAIAASIIWFFFVWHSIWALILFPLPLRLLWFFFESKLREWREMQWFKKYSYEFKQHLGPYGIRLINKAEKDKNVRKSLCEVFTPSLKQLQQSIEQLEMMDTLFRSGMRPDADEYQLHDLKLKFGKYRLEKAGIKASTTNITA